MLKVRTRRSCLHGGGVSGKATSKAKGFKKLLLTSYLQQDECLITSTSRNERSAPAELANKPGELQQECKEPEAVCPETQAKVEAVQSPRSHQSDEHIPGDSSTLTEDETIFSPAFHLIHTPEHPTGDGHAAEVSSPGAIQTDIENGASTTTSQDDQPGSEEPTRQFSQLSRCTSAMYPALEKVDETVEPAADLAVDVWDTEGDAVDDFAHMEFDPFIFIKRLPKLADVVPPFRPHLLPKQTRRCPSRTLVLDLDETLVHSTMDLCAVADFTFPVDFNNHRHTVHVRIRPHLHHFLDRVSQLFEVIVFTASQSVYAEKLLNILDPRRQRIQHRLFRDSCVFVDGNYLKDLSSLGRDLSKVAIIDNSPQAFGFQIENGIPIDSWFEDKDDRALLEMLPFLESIAQLEDVRPAIAAKFNMKARVDGACIPGQSQPR